MSEHGVKNGDETGRGGPWVVIFTSHLPYHVSAAWLIDEGPRSEETARNFAKFVTSEIDPAVAIRLGSATDELLRWRAHVAGPVFDRVHEAETVAAQDGTTVAELRELLARPYPDEPS